MHLKWITSAVLLLYGLLVAAGPQALFPVCENTTAPMKCTYAASAELGAGCLLVLLAVLMACTATNRERGLLTIAAMGTGLLAAAIPAFLIGGCKNPSMPCVMLTYPILYLLTGIAMAYLAGSLLLLSGIFKGRRPGKAGR